MEASKNHPHVRMIVPGGGISFERRAHDRLLARLCFLTVRALAAVARAPGGEACRLASDQRVQVFGKHASFVKCAILRGLFGPRYNRSAANHHPLPSAVGGTGPVQAVVTPRLASRAVSWVFLFRPNFAHVPGAPARSLLGRSGATSHPRARNQARPRHPRCAPSSRP
jgi:hypothetical protein